MCVFINWWSVTTSEDLHPLNLPAEGTEAIVTAGSRISVNNRTTSAEVLVERGSEGRLILSELSLFRRKGVGEENW